MTCSLAQLKVNKENARRSSGPLVPGQEVEVAVRGGVVHGLTG